MLGCTKKDLTRFKDMLQDAPHAWNHPLLLPLIFIKLQSRRLRDLVRGVTDLATDISDTVKKISNSASHKLPHDLIHTTSHVRVMSSIIQEDLVRASRQLAKITSHCEFLMDQTSTFGILLAACEVDTNVTQRFFDRFNKLDVDYQDLLADCKINSDAAAMFLDVVSSRATRYLVNYI